MLLDGRRELLEVEAGYADGRRVCPVDSLENRMASGLLPGDIEIRQVPRVELEDVGHRLSSPCADTRGGIAADTGPHTWTAATPNTARRCRGGLPFLPTAASLHDNRLSLDCRLRQRR